MIFDWQSLEDRLYEQSRAIILQFAAEHPDVLCSFFAYDTDPKEGYFFLGFDTYYLVKVHLAAMHRCQTA